MKNYIGKLGSAGSLQECSTVILNMFENLQGIQKHFKIFTDEIQIKQGIQYQGYSSLLMNQKNQLNCSSTYASATNGIACLCRK